jgi:hypothetical protein
MLWKCGVEAGLTFFKNNNSLHVLHANNVIMTETALT